MAAPMKAGMPPDLNIDGGYTVRMTAVDPATGAVVAGVVISGQAIQAVDLVGTFADEAPPPRLVPTSQTV